MAWYTGYTRPRHEDLASRDLQAYVKNELRGDVSVLYVRPRRGPSRLRRWLARPASAVEAKSVPGRSSPRQVGEPDASPQGGTVTLPSPAAFTEPLALGKAGIPCAHPIHEDLGGGSGVSYSRCLSCGAVLVLSTGGRWVIPPADPRDPRESPTALAPPLSNYP